MAPVRHKYERHKTRLAAAAVRPVDAASVAAFRIMFGATMCFSMLRFMYKGWVSELYLEPANHLTYPAFGWVRPLPGVLMYLLVLALACLGLGVAVGYRPRYAAGLLTIGVLYLELLDATLYLNHYWLVTLLALLFSIMPIGGLWSMDAAAGRGKDSHTVPQFVVWVFRVQLSCVYIFAGIAKLNTDWLVHAQPMRLWLADRAEIYAIGPILATTETAYAASWAGVAFDCTIVGWLLWKRSRPIAYVTLVFFHLATGALFAIGVFPILMILATLMFFEPDWPRRVFKLSPSPVQRPAPKRPPLRRPLLGFLALFASVQLLVPLRHYAYDNNVRWTEQGYYGSWRVMLSEKVGYLRFEVTDPTTEASWLVKPEIVLTDWQAEQVAIRPDLILATAHLVAAHYQESGLDVVEVRAITAITLNGRQNRPIIDPDVDLAAMSRIRPGDSWLIPLEPST